MVFLVSARRVTLMLVQVTEADVARIPPGNLRVPSVKFVELWVAVEKFCDAQSRRGVVDWYAAAVAVTYEWLAGAVVPSFDGRLVPAAAPVTGRSVRAYEELIEAEFLAAEALDQRRPRPRWLLERPGWSEGICATLRWAWRGSGPPPLLVDDAVAT
jgi:hypothetical protein